MVRSDGQFLVAAAGFSEKGRKRKIQNLEWLINVKFNRDNYFSFDKIPPSIVLLSYLAGMYPQGRPVRPRSHLNFEIP